MLQNRQGWRKRLDDESGMSLIEVMVSMIVIVVVLLGTARIMIDTFGIQQDSESQSKSVQLARDYIERSQQASYGELGFYSNDEGFQEYGSELSPDTGSQEETVIIPDSRDRSSILPTDTRTVGGVVYDIRVDITTTDNSYAYAPKRVTVTVAWEDSKSNTQDTVMSVVRSPSASEQIPPALDLTASAGTNGAPSSPSFYDEINQYAGTASDVLGREYSVKVAHQGTSTITDVIFYIYCSGDVTSTPVEVSWNSPPSGWTSSIAGSTYYLGYYGAPSNLPCQINTATTEVVAINSAGSSAPMTIMPDNFLTY